MTSMTLYPVKDVSIQEFKPDRNYGDYHLVIDECEHAVWRAFIGFDISSAPVSADVVSVSLYMFVRDSARFRDSPGTIHRITGSWEESSATWDNSHDVATSDTILSRTFKHAEYEPIWDVQDVTSLYNEAKDAGDVLDLQLRTEELYARNHYRGNEFDSKETRVFTDQEPYDLQKPYLLIEYAELPELALSDIEISRRYGSKFYLQGEIQAIVADDELCLMYSRPGSADLLNLPGLVLDYTYIHGTTGTFDLLAGGKFIEFSASGYYIFELWRATGTCEIRTEKVAEYFLNLEAPKYQYQLYFDVDAPEIADNRHLLQSEYDKYEAARPWTTVLDGEDCFSRIEPSALYPGGTIGTGWLCQAGEFLGSGCSPLPWWVCPSLTDWDIYMRGECSCSNFRDNLQHLGIPCMHLIAAKEHYGSEPPYCPYVQCG